MYTDKNLQPIADNAPYADSKGTKYPRNYPKNEIPELIKVSEVIPPADTDTETVTGFIIDETHTQVWQTRAKTAEELQEEKDGFNRGIDAQLREADLSIIRALVEGDTTRINEHKTAQEAKRLEKL